MKLLIDFKNTASNEDINQYINNNMLLVIKAYNEFEKLYLVEALAIPPSSDLIEQIVSDEDSNIVPLSNSTVTLVNSDENDWWKIASVEKLNRQNVTHTIPKQGSKTIVYVVDSGIEIEHQEFSNTNISRIFSFNNDDTDYNGHGTAIASLLCGNTCSISQPIVKAVKIFQSETPTRLSDLLNGLEAVITDVKQTPGFFHVVNMSWGVSSNPWLESKIRDLISHNVIVVAAAGNSGSSLDDITPARMPEVFTIGSFSKSFTPCDFTNYSGAVVTTKNTVNTGNIDCWAPGELIMVAAPGGTYGVAAGTSMSAAIHSAALSYNSDSCLVGSEAPSSSINFLNFISVGRKEFLDLGDAYSSAQNIKTIFYANSSTSNPKSGLTIELSVESDQAFQKLLAPSFVINNITALGSLPDGVTIVDNYISGTLSVESTETSIYQLKGMSSDQEYVFNLQLTVVSADDHVTSINDAERFINLTSAALDESNENESKV